ncbi:GSCOCG00003015001-RA-CDS [Cotesia congregata]|nr:GSCOCG00003015001-RA-CDS [Cotesia congregata]
MKTSVLILIIKKTYIRSSIDYKIFIYFYVYTDVCFLPITNWCQTIYLFLIKLSYILRTFYMRTSLSFLMNDKSQLNMAIHLIVLAAIIITVDSDTIIPTADNEVIISYREYEYVENHFATMFYQALAKDTPGNFVYSPLSAHIALSTLAIGAHGQALEDIRIALIDVPDSKTLDKYEVNSSEITMKGNVNFFNQLFIDNNFKVLPEYKTAIKMYGSGITNVDFTDPALASHQINSWSRIITNGRISTLVSEASLYNTKLLVINAMYFKAMWVHKFQGDTILRPFHINGRTHKQIPMMLVNNLFNFNRIPNCDAEYIRLPFRTSSSRENLNMYIIVPIQKNGLQKLEDNFHKINFTAIHNDKALYRVEFYMPKFKIETTVNLNQALKDIGIGSMFDDTADFSGISKNGSLKVDQVLQKTFIEVDEEGSEASTTTAVHNFQPTETKHRGNVHFEVNHPFMVVIASDEFIIFAGRVKNPSAMYY